MHSKEIQDILTGLVKDDVFIVNDRYECSFDYSKNEQLFSEWTPLSQAKSRLESECEVNVYDKIDGIKLQGLIVMSDDTDLVCQHSTWIYIKDVGANSWKSGMQIMALKKSV